MATPARDPRLAVWSRRLARASLLVALLVAGLTWRVWSSSGEELARADTARAAGDLEGAIDHYRRAALWYFPGNLRVEEAYQALAEIGHDARVRGDSTLALAAFRATHAAAMSTRHVAVPHQARREHADEQIAELMAEGTVPPIDASRSLASRREAYLAMLREERDVSSTWALLALLGFAAWVSGAATLLSRGFDEDGEVIAREAWRWGTFVIVGFGCFVLGLALA